MIDIHVIPNPDFDENCIQVIRALQHPLTQVQVGDYIEGNVLEARRRAYERGTCPYVSWADGDDQVLDTEWFELAIHILDSYPYISAVYPRWQAVKNNRVVKVTPVHVWNPQVHSSFQYVPFAHHLTVMRRYQVLDLLDVARANVGGLMGAADRYLMSALVRYGQLCAIDNIAYEWHLHPGTARTKGDPPETVKWVRERAAVDNRIAKSMRLVNPVKPWLMELV